MTQRERLQNSLIEIQKRILRTDEVEQPELIEEFKRLAQEIALKIQELDKEKPSEVEKSLAMFVGLLFF